MIAVRDVDLLRTLILKKGYNYAMFSRTINISRSSLNKIFSSLMEPLSTKGTLFLTQLYIMPSFIFSFLINSGIEPHVLMAFMVSR